jgi:glycosyltransferase involved in cell wall biosynthesis
MNVLQVATFYDEINSGGGPVSVAVSLTKQLQRMGHKSTFVSMRQMGNKDSSQIDMEVNHLLLPSFSFHSRYKQSSRVPVAGYVSLIRIIKSSDFIHVHFARDFFPLFVTTICILLRKKYLLQCHGMVRSQDRLLIKIFDRMFLKYSFMHAKNILALTPLESERLPSFKHSVLIVPNGIHQDTDTSLVFPKRYDFAFIGRLAEIKRVDRFLDVSARLLRKHPEDNLQFLICGPEGDFFSEFKELYRNLGNLDAYVFLPGVPRNSIMKLLQECSVVLLTSETENFPMLVVEAFSVGTPVLMNLQCDIASAILLDFPELIVDMNNLDSFADSAAEFRLTLNNSSMQKQLRDYARRNFDIEKISTALVEIYSRP